MVEELSMNPSTRREQRKDRVIRAARTFVRCSETEHPDTGDAYLDLQAALNEFDGVGEITPI
jgi:hypothetical protein